MASATVEARLHGFVVVDKPATWTSHDVVGWMRRLLGERQIGHGGTLDPAATGVLPVGVGYATRLMEFLSGNDKSYVANIRFGVETDSFDGDGAVISLSDSGGLSRTDIEKALHAWVGPRMQEPPMHSAIKIGGTRLYDAARRGEEIDRPLRSVTFHALELLRWDPPDAEVYVRCSKGTYIRSLAHDLGRDLATGAYLANLVRTQTGPFCLAQAWTLAELKQFWEEEGDHCWPNVAVHPDAVISNWPAVLLDKATQAHWLNGQAVPGPEAAGRCRAFSEDGDWLGIGRAMETGTGWQPHKVMGAIA